MKIKVKNYHPLQVSLLIQAFDQQTQQPISGILLDKNISLGTVNFLNKIKKVATSEASTITETEKILIDRFKDETGNIPTDKFKEFNTALQDFYNEPCFLEFEPVDFEKIKDVSNGVASCQNPDIIDIITGTYIYPEDKKSDS